jgi:hypothetical protein
VSKEEIPVEFRPATEADEPFIRNSFYRSFGDALHGCPCCTVTEDGVRVPGKFYDKFRPLLDVVLGDARTVVAHAPGDPDLLMGWAAGKDDRLVYVYTKHVYRKLQVGKRLLAQFGFKPGDTVPTMFPTLRGVLWGVQAGYRPARAPLPHLGKTNDAQAVQP